MRARKGPAARGAASRRKTSDKVSNNTRSTCAQEGSAVGAEDVIRKVFSECNARFSTWWPEKGIKKDGTIKWNKSPVRVEGDDYAKVNDPTTWSDLDTALKASGTPPKFSGRKSGWAPRDGRRRLAFHMAPHEGSVYGAIDLDLCLSPLTGELEPWAYAILALPECGGLYIERSPSGLGLKIPGRVTSSIPPFKRKFKVDAPLPAGTDRSVHDGAGLEVFYGQGYSATTGDHFLGPIGPLQDITRLVAVLSRGLPESVQAVIAKSSNNASAVVGGEVVADAGWAAHAGLGRVPEEERQPSAGLPEDIEMMLEAIPNNDADYDDWLRIGAALHDGSNGGEDGRSLWLAWSSRSSKHDVKNSNRVWNAFKLNRESRVTIASIVYLAQQNGYVRAPANERDLTEDGLALGLGRDWCDSWRYVAKLGRWYRWSGSHWAVDESLVHFTESRAWLRARAKELVADANNGAPDERDKLIEQARRTAARLRNSATISSVVALARSNSELVLTVDELDRDPWLLGTPGGTVDLRTGQLRPAQQSDYITKRTAVAPAPECTGALLFQNFLKQIFAHDLALIGFIQRAGGLSLIGKVIEHKFFYWWGQGRNGKTTLLELLLWALGDYGKVLAFDSLLEQPFAQHPTDLADLRDVRFASASEPPPNKRWNESRLKDLTGGSRLKGRFMRQDYFEFDPQLTLFAAGNNKPSFHGVDHAIRERVMLVPFLQNIPAAKQDRGLLDKLKAEGPAILRWLVEGCLAYQRQGLNPPDCVIDASKRYLDGEDVLGQFLAECCVEAPGVRSQFVMSRQLYQAWEAWCLSYGHQPGNSRTFGNRIEERDHPREERNVGTVFTGLALRPSRMGDVDRLPM